MPASPSPGTRVFEAPALLRYPGKDPAPAVVTLRRRGRRVRLAAVARTWAICWLAVPSVALRCDGCGRAIELAIEPPFLADDGV